MRILVANEGSKELDALTRAAEALGDVVAREVRVAEVARVAAEEEVDLALVSLPAGENAEHALAMIGQLVKGGLCPVVAVAADDKERFLARAAQLGGYAQSSRLHAAQLRGAGDVGIRPFREHAHLEGLKARRPRGAPGPPQPRRAGQGHPHGALRTGGARRVRDAAPRGPRVEPADRRGGRADPRGAPAPAQGAAAAAAIAPRAAVARVTARSTSVDRRASRCHDRFPTARYRRRHLPAPTTRPVQLGSTCRPRQPFDAGSPPS